MADNVRAKDVGIHIPGQSSGKFVEKKNTDAGDAVADELVFQARAAAAEPGTMGAYPEYWRRQAALDALIAKPAPAEYTDTQKTGYDSVLGTGFGALNLDAAQPWAWTAWHIGRNEELARDVNGVYRDAKGDAELQKVMDEYWDARVDRLAELRVAYETAAATPVDGTISPTSEEDTVNPDILVAADDPRALTEVAYIDIRGLDGFEPDERVFYFNGHVSTEKRIDFTQFAPADLDQAGKLAWCKANEYWLQARFQGAFPHESEFPEEDNPSWDRTWWGRHTVIDAGLTAGEVIAAIREQGLFDDVRGAAGKFSFER